MRALIELAADLHTEDLVLPCSASSSRRR